MHNIQQLEPYARVLDALHKNFSPHAGQIGPGRALFYEGVKRVALVWGRQCGKSVFCSYAAVRWALTHPDSRIFIVGPFLTQARAIYLFSGLIKSKCPDEFPVDIHIADGRFTFPNGSTIKICGADNVDGLRGITADLVIVDEIKQIKEDFWPVIYPTLLARRAPLVVAGTPPGEHGHYYFPMMEEAKKDPDWRYYKLRTVDNPYIDPKDIEKERLRYERNGDLSTFLREYEAEFALDEKRAVFPMFDEKVHVRTYQQLWYEIRQKPHHWDFVIACDPASASTWAALLGAVNRYDGRVRFLDEVYVQDQGMTSIGAIWPTVSAKRDEILQTEEGDDIQWTIVVDEAATAVRVELSDQFDVATLPTAKALNKKSYGISLLKDLMVSQKLLVSDRCKHYLDETKRYFLNDRGEFIKKDDHLQDCARYLLHAAHYTMRPEPAPVPHEIPRDEQRRGYSLQEDWDAFVGDKAIYLSDSDDDY